LVLDNSYGLSSLVFSGKVLYGTIVVLPLLMMADIPMFGFKFKSFGWKGNEARYLFIILAVVLLATLKFAAISLIIILYIIFSIALNLIKR
jgi:CDP-diacylglycerol--serine O-phosphatidyltransferase